MGDASGTETLTLISSMGQYPLYCISNDDVDNGDDIPVDDVSNSPFQAGDRVLVVGANNITQETQLGGGTTSVEYNEATMVFTITDGSASASTVEVWFYYLGQ